MPQFFIPPSVHALGHVTVQDLGPSCMIFLGQWAARTCDLNRFLRSIYTVGLVCFSPLPLPSASARARLLEDEKHVDLTHVALVVPAMASRDQLRACQPQPCEQAQPRLEESFN